MEITEYKILERSGKHLNGDSWYYVIIKLGDSMYYVSNSPRGVETTEVEGFAARYGNIKDALGMIKHLKICFNKDGSAKPEFIK